MENRNELLLSILRWIHGTRRKVAPLAYLHAQARSEAWPDLDRRDLRAELDVLWKDEELIEKVDELSAEASTWRITGKGINYLIEKGIVD